jgi:AAA family ATP:ADP antiporter
MLGSLTTALLVTRLGAAATLVIAAVLLEAAARCVRRLAAPAPARAATGDGAAPCTDGGSVAWLPRVARSPYFLALCAYLVLFTATSTIFYLEQARIVRASLPDTASRAALFARMDLAANALALALQLLVAGRLLRALGLGPALMVLPSLTLALFGSLRVAPSLATLVACQVARRALDFALAKPAREILFTVVRREDKYKAKGLIDTFVYRAGDAGGAWGADGLPAPALAGVMAVLCVAWAIVGLVLGRGAVGGVASEPVATASGDAAAS